MATVEENEDSIIVTVDEPDEVIISDIGDSLDVSDAPDHLQNINDAPVVSVTQYTGIGQLTSKPAGEEITQGKVVACIGGEFFHADNTNLAMTNAIVGVAMATYPLGGTAQVLQIGKVENIGWTWTPDLPLFLSTDGDMTQTPPITGFSIIIGTAITATEINFEIKTPVVM